MSEFLNFLVWILVILFCLIFVVGFNRQIMEKNRQRDEIIAKRKAAKNGENGEKNEVSN